MIKSLSLTLLAFVAVAAALEPCGQNDKCDVAMFGQKKGPFCECPQGSACNLHQFDGEAIINYYCGPILPSYELKVCEPKARCAMAKFGQRTGDFCQCPAGQACNIKKWYGEAIIYYYCG